jgi:hypothetical protein
VAAARLTDDLEPVIREQGGEPVTGQGMVVDDQHARLHD